MQFIGQWTEHILRAIMGEKHNGNRFMRIAHFSAQLPITLLFTIASNTHRRQNSMKPHINVRSERLIAH